MKYRTIEFKLDRDDIAHITLNQPEKHNALSPQMMGELIAAFTEVANAVAIRAVILSGAGRSFCAGGDLKWMQDNLDKTRPQRIAESRVLGDLFEVIDRCPKLVIGRINGPAYGGGIGLISVCDIAIGASSGLFALTEVKLGLVPANIAPYVLRKIGPANMRRTALNAMRFDAHEALRLNLLDQVVSPDALDDAVEREKQLALTAAPGAIASTKKMLAELASEKREDPADYLIEMLADTWEGEEAQAGIRAFFAREKPPWVSD